MSVKNPFQLRKFVIGGVATGIVLIYMIRLFTLQLWSDDYKKNADSNAFRKEILYPSRGLIYDRKGRILVYNEPSYNIMVVMNDQRGVDTLDFCETVGITKDDYIRRMAEIKDSRKIQATRATPPSSSWRKFPPATFPYSAKNSSASRASVSKKRSTRQYSANMGAHILGDVGEISERELSNDSDKYYRSGDYIGKLGVERSYEKQLRGEKGMRIMLRDVHGRTQGHYMNGQYDKKSHTRQKTSPSASTKTFRHWPNGCSPANSVPL